MSQEHSPSRHAHHPGGSRLSSRVTRAELLEANLEHVRRNRAIYSEYLDTIMVDHWTMAPVLASFKRRFGRLNDVVNGAMSRSVHVSRRLADLVRWTRSR